MRRQKVLGPLDPVWYARVKDTLKEGEFLILCDFPENYAFVVQNAAQSFHWNNDQATIFTVVICYKEDNIPKHRSLSMLSDCLTHNRIAVYEFQKIITHYLKENLPTRKMIYFTDEAAQHFKNKYNFINLLHHEMNFGIPAEWHCHATARGKALVMVLTEI